MKHELFQDWPGHDDVVYDSRLSTDRLRHYGTYSLIERPTEKRKVDSSILSLTTTDRHC